MAKKKESKVEVKEEEVVIGFGDQINFIEIFRIKGKQGLFTMRSKVSDDGIVGMYGFLDAGITVSVKAMDLECLGQFKFNTYAGEEDLEMKHVFNNLFDYQEAAGVGDYPFDVDTDIKPLMPVMVPEFDPDRFKDYHAKKVLMFYNIIVNKLKELKDEEPVEEGKKEN